MNSKSLEPQHVHGIARQVAKMNWYLARLTGRMHQKHFPLDDPLKVAADDAAAAVAKLHETMKTLEQSHGKSGSAG